MKKTTKSESEWRKILTKEQFEILRNKKTEAPGTCELPTSKDGIFYCIACDNPLFISKTKFRSGTGWPSFFGPYSKNSIELKPDDSLGIERTEVICAKCDGHLGHVFNDGPPPTHKRYCINGKVLKFKQTEKATFGAGCFWHVQQEFDNLDGVIKTEVGYMGGNEKKFPNPTYKQVCSGKTGCIEVTQITFNPNKISYKNLLETFWKIHDPTSINKQGNDVGIQYKSIIFYHNENQKQIAKKSKQEQQKKHKEKIATEISKTKTFFPAEEYHQKYLEKNSNTTCSI